MLRKAVLKCALDEEFISAAREKKIGAAAEGVFRFIG